MAQQRKFQRPEGYWSGRSLIPRTGPLRAVSEFVNSNRILVACVSLVVVAAVVVPRLLPDPPAPRTFAPAYFLNVSTGELEALPSNRIPPFRKDEGGIGGQTMVAAHVMSCGSCNKSEQFIAYIERFGGSTRQTLERLLANPRGPSDVDQITAAMDVPPTDREIADPDEREWVPHGSAEADDIRAAARERCDGRSPRPCLPSNADAH